ncbi:winged helix-turn-helix domain-containing tetratricopeptide repeat protein [Bradyrhizobium commune]|uniref:Winged helix-turn-helix domain-containing protein n=1 Tax=Bradyrhizobium commune TaxID=83627 RepID=A0A7S9GYT8_9BRAD|nr:winged helix-turn-helix domain-containing protein [Bradyrhizobium commune]QPF90196.1 winged helix-turn-helix domain-containing protein [Bradyrhizobium commune]
MRFLFESFVFDTDRRELHRGPDVVALAPQVFDLLEFLIRNRERVLSKDDLINAIWNGRSVSDAALTTRLNAARSAIGDSGGEQRLIKTLPRKGFRFVGPVQQEHGFPGAPVANDAQIEPSKPILALPEKPSVAVLPFQNLSDDPDQDYFVDGIVEDIIAGLSRSRLLFVISRNSSFTYRAKAIDIKRVGRELGVRYVLEGSLRKVGKKIRVTAQLIDATTGAHIWADKFDSDLEAIFDVQDRLTSSVIGAMSPQLERAEIERARRKPTESLQAYDYYLRSKFNIYQWTREGSDRALRMTRLAIALDPEFAVAYASGANIFGQKKGFGWIEDAAKERAESRQLAERAMQLDQDDPLVLAHAAEVYSYVLEEPETGSALAARAVALDPNLVMARLWAGWAQVYLGDHDAAIEQFSAAIRLSPIDPHLFVPQTGMAFAHFFAGQYEEGLFLATRAIQRQPNFPGAQRIRMSSLAMAGRMDEARCACDAVLRADPALRVSSIKAAPFRRHEDVGKLSEAWRIAGVPE